MNRVVVVGGGLAGCECAWQLAERGQQVDLLEQRPHAATPAHHTADLAELVCSNSLRAASTTNAVGALKEEMRRCRSLIIQVADGCRVPAGGALAVNRSQFAAEITQRIDAHPRIRIRREHCAHVPTERPCVIATGPLTSDALAKDLEALLGQGSLCYYDAIAPIISAESIDWTLVFRQSRFGREDLNGAEADAYVNCPFEEIGYRNFVRELKEGESVTPHPFERIPYFEGCLPVEVMAERGDLTLAFGPMKPIGLIDPRTGRRPFAVVQLRAEDEAQTAFNMVGFQTRMTHDAQRRVFRTIPGLSRAAFLRLGSMHRNTFVNAPKVLDDTLEVRSAPGVYLAGQITGVEGYVESAACGLICGMMLASGCPAPPPTTLLGGMLSRLTREDSDFQPSNITWAHVPPLSRRLRKRERKAALAERALADIDGWLAQGGEIR